MNPMFRQKGSSSQPDLELWTLACQGPPALLPEQLLPERGLTSSSVLDRRGQELLFSGLQSRMTRLCFFSRVSVFA